MAEVKPPYTIQVESSGDVIDDTVHVIEAALSVWRDPEQKQMILDIVTYKNLLNFPRVSSLTEGKRQA